MVVNETMGEGDVRGQHVRVELAAPLSVFRRPPGVLQHDLRAASHFRTDLQLDRLDGKDLHVPPEVFNERLRGIEAVEVGLEASGLDRD